LTQKRYQPLSYKTVTLEFALRNRWWGLNNCPNGDDADRRNRSLRPQGRSQCLVHRGGQPLGRHRLRLDRKLQRAAGRHARDMVKHDYFAHQRAGGPMWVLDVGKK
jgi:hypothetical protein